MEIEKQPAEDTHQTGKALKRGFNPLKLSLLGLAAALLLAFVALTVYVYRADPNDAYLNKIVRVIPYPAVLVNWQPINYAELLAGYNGLLIYYQTQADSGLSKPDDTELLANLMDNLIRTQIIQQIADERGIETDQSKVDRLMDQAVSDSGGTVNDLTDLINNNYGWSLDEFRQRVLSPLVLAAQVQDNLLADEVLQQEKKQVAEDALAQIESGTEFGEVAEAVSEDPSGADGGDLGYVRPSDFSDGWGSVLLSLAEGETSEVLEAPEVFGILHVNEIVDPDEDDPQMDVSVIIVSKRGIEDVVNEHLLNSKIWKLVQI